MAVDLGGVFVEFKSNVNQFVKEMRQVGFQLNVMESLAHSAEQKMRALMVTAQYGARAALAVWLDVAQAAGEVDQAMADLSTVLDTNARGFQKITDAAMEWSSSHVTSLNNITKATYDMASAGLDQVQIMETMNRAATLSVATFGSMDDATRAMSNAMLTFGKSLGSSMTEAQKAEGIMNTFAYTVQQFRIVLPELESGLSKVTGVANTFGASLEDMSVGIGMLKTAGLSAEEAGTALKNFYERIGKAASELNVEIYDSAGNINSLGNLIQQISESFGAGTTEVEKYSKLLTIFGQRGVKAVSILSNYTDELKEHADSVRNASTAYDMAASREEGFGAQMQILSNNIENFKVTLGESLVPLIKAFSEGISNLVIGFQQLSPVLQGFLSTSGLIVTVVTLIASGFGLVLKSISGLVVSLKEITGAFAALFSISHPVAAVIMGIATAVGVATTAFLALSGAQKRMTDEEKAYLEQEAAVADKISRSVDTLQAYVNISEDSVSVTEGFKEALDSISNSVPSYILNMDLLTKAYEGNKAALEEIIALVERYNKQSDEVKSAVVGQQIEGAEEDIAAINLELEKYQKTYEALPKILALVDSDTGKFVDGQQEALKKLQQIAEDAGFNAFTAWEKLPELMQSGWEYAEGTYQEIVDFIRYISAGFTELGKPGFQLIADAEGIQGIEVLRRSIEALIVRVNELQAQYDAAAEKAEKLNAQKDLLETGKGDFFSQELENINAANLSMEERIDRLKELKQAMEESGIANIELTDQYQLIVLALSNAENALADYIAKQQEYIENIGTLQSALELQAELSEIAGDESIDVLEKQLDLVNSKIRSAEKEVLSENEITESMRKQLTELHSLRRELELNIAALEDKKELEEEIAMSLSAAIELQRELGEIGGEDQLDILERQKGLITSTISQLEAQATEEQGITTALREQLELAYQHLGIVDKKISALEKEREIEDQIARDNEELANIYLEYNRAVEASIQKHKLFSGTIVEVGDNTSYLSDQLGNAKNALDDLLTAQLEGKDVSTEKIIELRDEVVRLTQELKKAQDQQKIASIWSDYEDALEDLADTHGVLFDASDELNRNLDEEKSALRLAEETYRSLIRAKNDGLIVEDEWIEKLVREIFALRGSIDETEAYIERIEELTDIKTKEISPFEISGNLLTDFENYYKYTKEVADEIDRLYSNIDLLRTERESATGGAIELIDKAIGDLEASLVSYETIAASFGSTVDNIVVASMNNLYSSISQLKAEHDFFSDGIFFDTSEVEHTSAVIDELRNEITELLTLKEMSRTNPLVEWTDEMEQSLRSLQSEIDRLSFQKLFYEIAELQLEFDNIFSGAFTETEKEIKRVSNLALSQRKALAEMQAEFATLDTKKNEEGFLTEEELSRYAELERDIRNAADAIDTMSSAISVLNTKLAYEQLVEATTNWVEALKDVNDEFSRTIELNSRISAALGEDYSQVDNNIEAVTEAIKGLVTAQFELEQSGIVPKEGLAAYGALTQAIKETNDEHERLAAKVRAENEEVKNLYDSYDSLDEKAKLRMQALSDSVASDTQLMAELDETLIQLNQEYAALFQQGGPLSELTEEQQQLLFSYTDSIEELIYLQGLLKQLKFDQGIEDFYQTLQDVNKEFADTIKFGESLRSVTYQAFGGAEEKVTALKEKVEQLTKANIELQGVGAEEGFGGNVSDIYAQYDYAEKQVAALNKQLRDLTDTYNMLSSIEDEAEQSAILEALGLGENIDVVLSDLQANIGIVERDILAWESSTVNIQSYLEASRDSILEIRQAVLDLVNAQVAEVFEETAQKLKTIETTFTYLGTRADYYNSKLSAMRQHFEELVDLQVSFDRDQILLDIGTKEQELDAFTERYNELADIKKELIKEKGAEVVNSAEFMEAADESERLGEQISFAQEELALLKDTAVAMDLDNELREAALAMVRLGQAAADAAQNISLAYSAMDYLYIGDKVELLNAQLQSSRQYVEDLKSVLFTTNWKELVIGDDERKEIVDSIFAKNEFIQAQKDLAKELTEEKELFVTNTFNSFLEAAKKEYEGYEESFINSIAEEKFAPVKFEIDKDYAQDMAGITNEIVDQSRAVKELSDDLQIADDAKQEYIDLQKAIADAYEQYLLLRQAFEKAVVADQIMRFKIEAEMPGNTIETVVSGVLNTLKDRFVEVNVQLNQLTNNSREAADEISSIYAELDELRELYGDSDPTGEQAMLEKELQNWSTNLKQTAIDDLGLFNEKYDQISASLDELVAKRQKFLEDNKDMYREIISDTGEITIDFESEELQEEFNSIEQNIEDATAAAGEFEAALGTGVDVGRSTRAVASLNEELYTLEGLMEDLTIGEVLSELSGKIREAVTSMGSIVIEGHDATVVLEQLRNAASSMSSGFQMMIDAVEEAIYKLNQLASTADKGSSFFNKLQDQIKDATDMLEKFKQAYSKATDLENQIQELEDKKARVVEYVDWYIAEWERAKEEVESTLESLHPAEILGGFEAPEGYKAAIDYYYNYIERAQDAIDKLRDQMKEWQDLIDNAKPANFEAYLAGVDDLLVGADVYKEGINKLNSYISTIQEMIRKAMQYIQMIMTEEVRKIFDRLQAEFDKIDFMGAIVGDDDLDILRQKLDALESAIEELYDMKQYLLENDDPNIQWLGEYEDQLNNLIAAYAALQQAIANMEAEQAALQAYEDAIKDWADSISNVLAGAFDNFTKNLVDIGESKAWEVLHTEIKDNIKNAVIDGLIEAVLESALIRDKVMAIGQFIVDALADGMITSGEMDMVSLMTDGLMETVDLAGQMLIDVMRMLGIAVKETGEGAEGILWTLEQISDPNFSPDFNFLYNDKPEEETQTSTGEVATFDFTTPEQKPEINDIVQEGFNTIINILQGTDGFSELINAIQTDMTQYGGLSDSTITQLNQAIEQFMNQGDLNLAAQLKAALDVLTGEIPDAIEDGLEGAPDFSKMSTEELLAYIQDLLDQGVGFHEDDKTVAEQSAEYLEDILDKLSTEINVIDPNREQMIADLTRMLDMQIAALKIELDELTKEAEEAKKLQEGIEDGVQQSIDEAEDYYDESSDHYDNVESQAFDMDQLVSEGFDTVKSGFDKVDTKLGEITKLLRKGFTPDVPSYEKEDSTKTDEEVPSNTNSRAVSDMASSTQDFVESVSRTLQEYIDVSSESIVEAVGLLADKYEASESDFNIKNLLPFYDYDPSDPFRIEPYIVIPEDWYGSITSAIEGSFSRVSDTLKDVTTNLHPVAQQQTQQVTNSIDITVEQGAIQVNGTGINEATLTRNIMAELTDRMAWEKRMAGVRR